MEDPREIHSDDDLAKLTADEQESPVQSSDDEDIEEQLKEIERQKLLLLEKKKQKRQRAASNKPVSAKEEVQKSPSPVKHHQTENYEPVKPRNLNKELLQESDVDHTGESVPEGSTSYFVNMLDQNLHKDQDQRDEAKRLLNARIYTFDSDLACEPFAVDEKEFFSGKQISKRYIKHDLLEKFLEGKKVLRIPKLFAKVCPPTFQEPRYPNWIVIGIISKKTVPKGTSDKKSKFMTMTLTDFSMNVDVHLFGESVEKYVKLRVGDIIALLNPQIFIWKPDHTGTIRSFSLSIKHSFDCILEIGRAKHFGLCPSLKKDGSSCGTPINTSFEDCCLFHKELRIRKTAGKRMELNGSFNMRSPTKNGRKQQFLMGNERDRNGNYTNSAVVEDRYAPKVDRISKSMVYFSNPHAGKAFFDDSYQNPDILKKLEEKKRKIKERKKEAEMSAKLLRLGQKPAAEKRAISEEEKTALKKKKVLTTAAFPGQSLRSIGYDPTSKPHTKGVLDSSEPFEKNDESLKELLSIAQKKNINLGLSKEERSKRKDQRKEANEIMERLKKREELKKEEMESVKKSNGKRNVSLESDDSDSDSDFEVRKYNEQNAYLKFKQAQK